MPAALTDRAASASLASLEEGRFMTPIHSRPGSGDENHAFGLTRRIRVASERTGDAFAIWEEEIPQGSGPPLHVHEREHEVFTVMSGRIRFRVAETEVEAGPGDVIVVPPGIPHTFKGLEDALALVQLSPGPASRFFAAVAEAGVTPDTDMDRITEIAAAHNIRFVGPPLD
jgi:quercetin dioxygenase-like cupin family protein